jgi:hypothetical protein
VKRSSDRDKIAALLPTMLRLAKGLKSKKRRMRYRHVYAIPDGIRVEFPDP